MWFEDMAMASSVCQPDDADDHLDDEEEDDEQRTMATCASSELDDDSDAEEWLAEEGGTFRRLNAHLDEPRRKMMDAAFEMQSLQVGRPAHLGDNCILHRMGSPLSSPHGSPSLEGEKSSFSRTKKVRRHEDDATHGDEEDPAVHRRARYNVRPSAEMGPSPCWYMSSRSRPRGEDRPETQTDPLLPSPYIEDPGSADGAHETLRRRSH